MGFLVPRSYFNFCSYAAKKFLLIEHSLSSLGAKKASARNTCENLSVMEQVSSSAPQILSYALN